MAAKPQNKRRRRGQRRLPVILLPLLLAVALAGVLWACGSPEMTTSPSSPEQAFSRQDGSKSDPTPPESFAWTEQSSAEPSGEESFAPSEEPEQSEEPDESEQPEQSEQSEQSEGTALSAERAAQILLERMSPEEKIYQLFVVTPEQLRDGSGTVTQADDRMRSALQNKPVGGVICFSGNIQTPDQVTQFLANLQAASRLGLFIAVDEEGGTVARLGKNPAMGTTSFPPMGEIGASGNTDNAYKAGRTIGNEIKRFGFNLNFAPIADVNSNPKNPVIGNRAFSSDPQIAAEMVAACVAGFKESGVLCTLKHFPGHGDTATDSHYGAAGSNKTLEELQACEFLPFRSGIAAGADVVMLGHISLPNVTGNDMPASLSREITTGLLREQLGFDGLIVTDSMSMEAITDRFSSGEAAVRAIQAGADMLLMPANLNGAVNGILDAVEAGALSESRLDESVYRILYAKLTQGIIPLTSVGQ